MSNFVLRISIWILGSLACFGNLLVIGWRIKDFQNGKVNTNTSYTEVFMYEGTLIYIVTYLQFNLYSVAEDSSFI